MDNLYYNVPANRGFGGFLKSLFFKQRTDYSFIEDNNIKDYFEAVRAAKLELDNIQRFFNSTADPDLIEYAIYEERAAKLKLSYLLKKAKENNIKCMDYISF